MGVAAYMLRYVAVFSSQRSLFEAADVNSTQAAGAWTARKFT